MASRREHRASITDVARKAGVSIATVSRTFSHPDRVSDTTRSKVLAASDELSFSISRTAGILKSGRSYRIALLVAADGPQGVRLDWYTSKVLEGLLSVFEPAGYDLTIVPISSLQQRKEFFDQLPLRNNVDAVVVSSFRVNPREVSRLRTMNVPVVGINVSSSAGFSATDSINDEKGMRLLLRHLVTLGHRDIVYIYQDFSTRLSYSSLRRVHAFNTICGQLGVRQHMLNLPTGEDNPDDVLSYLFGTNNRATVLCFHQDSLAIPVFIALARQGITVPTDLSITGFDDSTFAAQTGLTTIHQDPFHQAAHAAHMTLDLIEGRSHGHTDIEAPVSLVVRSSTAAPRRTPYLTH